MSAEFFSRYTLMVMKNLSQLAAGAFVATTTMLSAPAIAQEHGKPCALSPDTVKILTSRLARHPEFHSLVCDTRTGAEIVITLRRLDDGRSQDSNYAIAERVKVGS